MAFFGLSDISFNKGSADRKGPLAPLVNAPFQQNLLRYPLDVGNYDKGHYMVFYIRQQKNTKFIGNIAPENALNGTSSTPAANVPIASNPSSSKYSSQITNKINSSVSSINQATNNKISGITNAIGGAVNNVVGSVSNFFGQSSSSVKSSPTASTAIFQNSIKTIKGGSLGNDVLRTTVLTTDSIALYMPDTLQYTHSQSYDQLNLGDEFAGQVTAAGTSAYDKYKEGGIGAAGEALKKAGVANLTKSVSDLIGSAAGKNTLNALFTATTGVVVNPMLEMIYRSPNFRTFQFDFNFYPRDEKEALEVQKIIERFRFHQAPEISDAAGFLIAPSQFDIVFYYGGAQNPNIPPIATCVLTTIDVNYAPNGWSAYEIPGENRPALGRTGMPVAINVTLQFQEITYLTKADYDSTRAPATSKMSISDINPKAPTQ